MRKDFHERRDLSLELLQAVRRTLAREFENVVGMFGHRSQLLRDLPGKPNLNCSSDLDKRWLLRVCRNEKRKRLRERFEASSTLMKFAVAIEELFGTNAAKAPPCRTRQ